VTPAELARLREREAHDPYADLRRELTHAMAPVVARLDRIERDVARLVDAILGPEGDS
jgi:hypothetical protein